MPISIIGPMKIRKFARKRKKTKTTWIQNAGVESTWPIPCTMLAAAPPGRIGLAGVSETRKSQTIVMMPSTKMREAEAEAPGPRAAAVDDVLLAEPRLLACRRGSARGSGGG